MSTQDTVPRGICNYDRRYSRRVRVAVPRGPASGGSSQPTVVAINREIYVDKFDNISHGIELADPENNAESASNLHL